MFLKTLQWRLVSFFCLIAVCVLIPVWIYLDRSVENLYYDNFNRDIQRFIDYFESETGNTATVDDIMKYTINGNDSYAYQIKGTYKSCTIYDSKNNTIISSSEQAFSPENKESLEKELLVSNNFLKALSGKEGTGRKLVSYKDRQFFDYAYPVGDAKDFILYFRYYKDAWRGEISKYQGIIVQCLIFAFLFAFIMGYALSKTITAPIIKIMYKAKGVADGDFDQKLEVKSEDEIGNLTRTFNYMADNLKNTLAEISSEKSKIETVLNYMTDGIIAFNLEGEIIHINPAAKSMLGTTNISNNFNEYAKEYGFNINLEDILYLEDIGSKEVTINVGSKILRVYFAVFTDENKKPGGIIAVLQDITQQQKLEQMRKDFVANVSHEMRTPITSIKSYTETLLDGALDDRETTERFLSVINSEADRMTTLVKDLLQLSRLDNQQMQWKFELISFTQLVKSTVEKLEMEARRKGQVLECFTIGEIPDITADYNRIEQVMVNILSNSMKYTPEGGKISVYISKTSTEVYAKVSDNGIGIPEQDIPRLFERFYRVDKARSRDMGGTGLGLSIAKEIVEAHSGTINIMSQVGKGTEVTIKLPIGNQALVSGM